MSGNLDSLSSNVQEKWVTCTLTASYVWPTRLLILRYRKKTVDNHNQELEALEARLRATEERLKVVTNSQPGSRSPSQRREAYTTQQQPPLATNAAAKAADYNRNHAGLGEPEAMAGADEDTRPESGYKRSAAGKANAYSMPPAPRGMPDTPTSHHSAKDYVMVNRARE
jgi:hypothetical protein